MDPRVARALRRTGRVALSVTAVVGAVCALLTVLALVTGVRPLIFRSGSMGPDVPAGSLGFSRSTAGPAIKLGDVVTVTTKTDQRVTHRVVNVTHHNEIATLQLKGDANKTADEELYRVSSAPRLLFSFPKVGYVVNWFSHAPGSYVLALYVALMLVLIARRKDEGSSAGTPRAPAELVPVRGYLRPPVFSGEGLLQRGKGPRRAFVVGALVAGLSVALAGFGQSTWASWTDSATVSGSTITTGTFGAPAAPVITGCTPANGETGYALTWTWGPGNPTSFKMTYTSLVPASPSVSPTTFAGTARSGVSAPFNDRAGTINLVATVGGVDSVVDTATFSGKNSGKVCNF